MKICKSIQYRAVQATLLWTMGILAASAQTAPPNAELPAELEPYFNAIRMVESKNHPWTIFNNTTRESFMLKSRGEAESKAKELISYGHNVDLGIMQLNCRFQCKRPGVSLDNIFDPQVNIGIAKVIFLEFWTQARAISTEFKARIIAAVGAYNNGRVATPNTSYVQKVWAALGKAPSDIPSDGGAAKQDVADGNGKKSMLDEAMGRANKGIDWTKERIAQLTKKKEPQAKDQQSEDKGGDKNGDQGASWKDIGGALFGGLFGLTVGVLVAAAVWFLSPLLGIGTTLRMLWAVFGKKKEE